MFTLGHTLFFRQLPVDRPEDLVVVSSTRGRPDSEGSVAYPDYVSFRDRTKTLSSLAAHYSTAPLFVTANGNANDVIGGNNLAYDATSGWDFATGWGSMDGAALDAAWILYIKGGGA